MSEAAPIEIVATRGGVVESTHLVHAVVAGPDGDATHVFGQADRPTFPRSAIKAMQALPLLTDDHAPVESLMADLFLTHLGR